MRAIECPCGHHLEGIDDDELVRLARELAAVRLSLGCDTTVEEVEAAALGAAAVGQVVA